MERARLAALSGGKSENYGLVGDYFESFFSDIEKIAKTKVSVFISGETGTGKELLARAIHKASGRLGDFVVVNCGAIPEQLFESIVFGHERGSFTGAIQNNKGKAQQAENGTLFLDEIGNLSLKHQAAILRFLQDREVQVVGSAKTEKVDVRIISATNKNILKEIEAGRFMFDLYQRIEGCYFYIAPLRRRMYDLEKLIYFFCNKYCLEYSVDAGDISEICDQLLALNLGKNNLLGNVRELMKIVELCVIFREDFIDRKNELDGKPVISVPATVSPALVSIHNQLFVVADMKVVEKKQEDMADDKKENIPSKIDADERKNKLLAALEKNNGKVTKAAKDFGMSISSTFTAMKKYQLHEYAAKLREKNNVK